MYTVTHYWLCVIIHSDTHSYVRLYMVTTCQHNHNYLYEATYYSDTPSACSYNYVQLYIYSNIHICDREAIHMQ